MVTIRACLLYATHTIAVPFLYIALHFYIPLYRQAPTSGALSDNTTSALVT